MTYEKLNGAISIASNSPGMPTGYGVQAKMLTDRLKRHSVDVAILSNYGLEGECLPTSPHLGLSLFTLEG
jgi:hypothetical protein